MLQTECWSPSEIHVEVESPMCWYLDVGPLQRERPGLTKAQ